MGRGTLAASGARGGRGQEESVTVSERSFQAGTDEMFAVLIDAEHYPRWLVGAKEVHIGDPSWPQPGSWFHHKVGFGPIQIGDRTTVSAIEPGRSLDLIVRARPLIEADVHFEIVAAGTGSVLRMDERPRGAFRVLGPLLSLLVKPRNDRSLQRLADVID